MAKDIRTILDSGRDAVMAVDICSGIALKRAFGEQALLAFTEKPREELITSILDRDCPKEEKIKRILSLDTEFRNEEFCDVTVRTAEELLQQGT